MSKVDISKPRETAGRGRLVLCFAVSMMLQVSRAVCRDPNARGLQGWVGAGTGIDTRLAVSKIWLITKSGVK